MTRRDVAAMRLALEMLRLAYTGEYEVAHFHRVEAVDGAARALRLANLHVLADALEACGVDRKTMRATVARAALYIRARLRDEAGNYGPWNPCGFGEVGECGYCQAGWCSRCRSHNRRITPLWEQAATHGGGR